MPTFGYNIRLSKRDPGLVSTNTVDIPSSLLTMTQRSMRLSRRAREGHAIPNKRLTLRLSKRSGPAMPDHKINIRLSKRQMAELLSISKSSKMQCK